MGTLVPGSYVVAYWCDYPLTEVGRYDPEWKAIIHVKVRGGDEDRNYKDEMWTNPPHISFAVPPDDPHYDIFAAFEATCVMGHPRWELIEEYLT